MAKQHHVPQVLGALSFELTVPTAKTFLRRFLKAALPGDLPADTRLECLSSYLAELMLPEYGALQFLPSQVCFTFPKCDHCCCSPFACFMFCLVLQRWSTEAATKACKLCQGVELSNNCGRLNNLVAQLAILIGSLPGRHI